MSLDESSTSSTKTIETPVVTPNHDPNLSMVTNDSESTPVTPVNRTSSRHYFYRKASIPSGSSTPLLNEDESTRAFEDKLLKFIQRPLIQQTVQQLSEVSQIDLARRKADRRARKEKERGKSVDEFVREGPPFSSLSGLTPVEKTAWLSNINDEAMLLNPHQWLKLGSLFNVNSKVARQMTVLPDLTQLPEVLEDRGLKGDEIKPLENYLELRDLQNRNYARDSVAEGVKLIRLNRIKEAMEHYKRALDMDPKYAEGWFHVAEAFVQQKKLKEANEQLEKVLKLEPDHEGAKALLASVQHALSPKQKKKDDWDLVDEHGEDLSKKDKKRSTSREPRRRSRSPDRKRRDRRDSSRENKRDERRSKETGSRRHDSSKERRRDRSSDKRCRTRTDGSRSPDRDSKRKISRHEERSRRESRSKERSRRESRLKDRPSLESRSKERSSRRESRSRERSRRETRSKERSRRETRSKERSRRESHSRERPSRESRSKERSSRHESRSRDKPSRRESRSKDRSRRESRSKERPSRESSSKNSRSRRDSSKERERSDKRQAEALHPLRRSKDSLERRNRSIERTHRSKAGRSCSPTGYSDPKVIK